MTYLSQGEAGLCIKTLSYAGCSSSAIFFSKAALIFYLHACNESPVHTNHSY